MAQVGRPSDYTPELVALAEQYLSAWQTEGHAIPSIAGLASYLGITRQTVHQWCKEQGKEPFSYIVDQILINQEISLISNGLKGDFNASIAKLILGKHGYSDKVEQELTGKDGAPLAITFNGVQTSDGRRS